MSAVWAYVILAGIVASIGAALWLAARRAGRNAVKVDVLERDIEAAERIADARSVAPAVDELPERLRREGL